MSKKQKPKMSALEAVNVRRLLIGIQRRVNEGYELCEGKTTIVWQEMVRLACKGCPVRLVHESPTKVVVHHDDSGSSVTFEFRPDPTDSHTPDEPKYARDKLRGWVAMAKACVDRHGRPGALRTDDVEYLERLLAELDAEIETTVCEDTGRQAVNGECPIHHGDACLYDVSQMRDYVNGAVGLQDQHAKKVIEMFNESEALRKALEYYAEMDDKILRGEYDRGRTAREALAKMKKTRRADYHEQETEPPEAGAAGAGTPA